MDIFVFAKIPIFWCHFLPFLLLLCFTLGQIRINSYDVSALFTLVPVDPALNVIKDLLEKDHTIKERTVLAVSDIILLSEFCLKNTYFSFKAKHTFCPLSSFIAHVLFTLPSMPVSMLSKQFRVHISTCISIPLQT